MTKVGDIVLVESSWALCGIMEGNEYEVSTVSDDGKHIGVTNGVFFSSLDADAGDKWKVVG